MAKKAMHPNSLKNLKSVKPGQILNPKGRPKTLPELKDLLIDILGDEKDDTTAIKAILMRLRQKAVAGDIKAAEVLLDRAYGKSHQPVTATNININHNSEPLNAERIKDISKALEDEC